MTSGTESVRHDVLSGPASTLEGPGVRALHLISAGRALQTTQPPSGTPPPGGTDTDVTVTRTETVWYANPVWIAIAVLGAGLLVVLIALALRGPSNREATTTIIHD
jgi:hypothetical protein